MHLFRMDEHSILYLSLPNNEQAPFMFQGTETSDSFYVS